MDGQPRVLFSRVQYTLATEEAERIGVDHIARSSITGSTQTSAGQCRHICSTGVQYTYILGRGEGGERERERERESTGMNAKPSLIV